MSYIRLRPNTAFPLIAITWIGILPASAIAASISKSYHVHGTVINGSIVSLDSGSSDTVRLSNSHNASLFVGIVTGANDSLLAINPSTLTTQVAIDGSVPALVSNLNGNINIGEHISMSSLSGVGEKAESGLPVVGTAESAFTDSSLNASTQPVTDKQGKPVLVKVGYIRLSIGTTTATVNGGIQLNSLQKFFQTLTGHVISTARIIMSLAITCIGLLIISILMYGSIFGSLISIGRNPLSKYSVLKALRSVLGLALFISIIACFTVYLLLA